jgi:GNAT superfamily N-acetyltransferase
MTTRPAAAGSGCGFQSDRFGFDNPGRRVIRMATMVYHLEMRDGTAFRPKAACEGFEVSMVAPPMAELNRRMYEAVGGPWGWTDRLEWSDEKWYWYVDCPTLETWVGRLQGESAGYFELERQDGGDVEIAYFGLLPEFIGRGLGGQLLSAAVERAWQLPGTRRVWVHTCTKDHEHALDNYLQRGFELFKSERT